MRYLHVAFLTSVFFILVYPGPAGGAVNKVDGHLGLQTLAAINQEDGNSEEGVSFVDTDLLLKHRFSDRTRGVFSFSGEKRIDQEHFLYDFPEANVRTELSDTSFIAGGRILLNWSDADCEWRLGLINGKKNFSLLDPGQVGLNVMEASFGGDPVKVSFIGSFFYTPEKNPSFYVTEKGELKGNTVYTRKYPRQTRLSNNAEVPLVYEKHPTSFDEVVFKKTYGVNIEYQFAQNTLNFYYLFKPENTFRVYVDYRIDTENDRSLDRVKIDVRSEFFNHHVFGGDFRSKLLGFDFATSAITVVPESRVVEEGSDAYGEFNEYRGNNSFVHVGLQRAFRRALIKLQYLKELIGSRAESEFFGVRNMWKEAFNFYVEGLWNRKWKSMFDFKASRVTNDIVFGFETNYLLSKNVFMGLGFQVVSAGSDGSSWKDFADRDMAYSRLGYYF